MTGASFLFLSQEDVVAAGGLEIRPTIETVAEALRLHARGDTVLPHKPTIRWSADLDSEERDGRIMAMPAYVGGSFGVAGVKWIPSVPSNPARGLPRGIGMVVLTSRETGLPLAVMDGTVVSAMRTAAVTGVACRLLAPPGAGVVALLGAGAQAHTQLLALEAELVLGEVRVFDSSPGRAEAFCAREAAGAGRESFDLAPVASAEEACRGASVIVPVTIAPQPYVPPNWLDPGSLFVSISSLDPTVDVIRGADLLVCDDWEHETGHPSRPFARAIAEGAVPPDGAGVRELGRILTGEQPGRASPNERVFVSPVGLAIEDVAAAHRVYGRARDLGIGTTLELWRSPLWP
jgi:ornithine cyclodeaminase/alanine dehydrogenase-like protein (mu-crystallin family)